VSGSILHAVASLDSIGRGGVPPVQGTCSRRAGPGSVEPTDPIGGPENQDENPVSFISSCLTASKIPVEVDAGRHEA